MASLARGRRRTCPWRNSLPPASSTRIDVPQIDPAKDVKSVRTGATTQVWCATSPQLEGVGGVFCVDSDIAPPPDANLAGFSVAESQSSKRNNGVAPYVADRKSATRLWEISERLTGVRFLD